MSKVLTGKWKWNDVINPMDAGDQHMLHYLWFRSGFKSNGQSFEGIRLTYGDFWKLEYDTGSGYVEAGAGYREDNYAMPFEQYRVIDFSAGSEADDDTDGTFVKWFLSNVTRYGTVAEKLVQIAENEQKVYKAGYNKALELDGYNEGFEAGEGAIWNIVQHNGNRTDYSFAFQRWSCDVLHPKYKVVPTGNIRNFVYDCDYLKKIEAKYFDMSKIPYGAGADGSYYYCFGTCGALEEIEDIGMQPNYSYSYFCCYNGNLKKVACIRLDENSIVSNMLYSCEKLEDVTIEGTIGQSGIDLKWSTKLSRASIESFINALSETASGQRITFSITAVKNAFGGGAWDSDGDGKDDTIMGSVEWIDLMNSKSNWTITLA